MGDLFLAFITGLTTGGLSCFAVQGSLLTSSLTNSGSFRIKGTFFFLISKIISYTVLGAFLGFLGTAIVISPKIQGWFQILVGFYMLITAGRLANLSPLFRYTVIQPPKFIFRFLRRFSISDSLFVPVILGALTILIPCGVTQAMMIYAVGTGNPLSGAAIMFSFILGTFPIFVILGFASSKIFKSKLLTILAASVIAIIGILSINGGQILRGSVHTIQNYWMVLTRSDLVQGPTLIQNGKQNVLINVTGGGYKTTTNTLKLGVPVKLTLKTANVMSCARGFVIPSLNYSRILPVTGVTVVEFTPNTLGQLTYTCSMGMYSGSFNVIK